MSQRLMLTALKSAHCAPFGIEEREREKKWRNKNETEDEERRGEKNKNKLKVVRALGNYLTSIFFMP